MRHTCFVRDKLPKDRVSAGADVLCAGCNTGAAVVAKLHISLGGISARDPGTTGHAPSHDQAVAFHRADLGISICPAERFSAELETFKIMPRRKRHA